MPLLYGDAAVKVFPRSKDSSIRPGSAATIDQGRLRVSILGWEAWSPRLETREAWHQWAGSGTHSDETPPLALPMMLRRRLSPFGHRLFGVLAASPAGLPPARYV